jgi:hypothetical protein
MTAHRHFHYHASAHALSGELTRPVQRVIEVQAGISLPSTGGVGSSHVENFRFDEVVSFKRAYSHVAGSVKEENGKKIHTTHATATVEGLNILDVVTADRIVARLSSSFEEPPPQKPGPFEGRVLLVGSKFENLSIAGYQVDVELDHELLSLELGTFAAVRDSFRARGSKLRQIADETLKARGVNRTLPEVLAPEGPLLCSIVKEVHFKEPGFCKPQEDEDKDKKNKDKKKFIPPGVEPIGRHAYHVVDFGDVFLSEVLCQHGRKTLTMLRIELGSPNGGGFIAAEADSNGWPPWGS